MPLVDSYDGIAMLRAVLCSAFTASEELQVGAIEALRPAAEVYDAVGQLPGEGRIRPHIDAVLPLEQVKDAMRAIAARRVKGRLLSKTR